MTNMKDKLSASVRQARAEQQAVTTEDTPAPAPTKKPAAPKAAAPTKKPAAPKTAAPKKTVPSAAKPPARKPPAQRSAVTSANTVQDSGSALFPQRVWPD